MLLYTDTYKSLVEIIHYDLIGLYIPLTTKSSTVDLEVLPSVLE